MLFIVCLLFILALTEQLFRIKTLLKFAEYLTFIWNLESS